MLLEQAVLDQTSIKPGPHLTKTESYPLSDLKTVSTMKAGGGARSDFIAHLYLIMNPFHSSPFKKVYVFISMFVISFVYFYHNPINPTSILASQEKRTRLSITGEPTRQGEVSHSSVSASEWK